MRSEYRAVLAAFAIVAEKKQEALDRGAKSIVSCFLRFTEPPLKECRSLKIHTGFSKLRLNFNDNHYPRNQTCAPRVILDARGNTPGGVFDVDQKYSVWY